MVIVCVGQRKTAYTGERKKGGQALKKTDRIKQVQHVRGGGVSPHINQTLIYNISHYLNRITNLHIYTLYCGLTWDLFPLKGPKNGKATNHQRFNLIFI